MVTTYDPDTDVFSPGDRRIALVNVTRVTVP